MKKKAKKRSPRLKNYYIKVFVQREEDFFCKAKDHEDAEEKLKEEYGSDVTYFEIEEI